MTSPAADSVSNTSGGLQIMVVEDSHAQALWLSHVLKKHGHRVTIASDGQEALDALEVEIPDLVISDIVMPNVDGYELCHAIKSSPATAHLLVLLATSQKEPSDVIEGLAAGADSFLTKPFDEDAVIFQIGQMTAWQRIDVLSGDAKTITVEYDGQWYEVSKDARRSIHFLVSAIRETDKQNQLLEAATRRAEDALERVSGLEADLRELIEMGAVAMCVVGPDGSIQYANRAAAELLDYPVEELTGSAFPFVIEQIVKEITIKRRDGSTRACEMRVSTTTWYGETSQLVSFWDVTEDVLVREELKSISTTDELTGLLNRRGFLPLAEHEIELISQPDTRSRGLVLLFVDIDLMKEINDDYGHDAGDDALREVAAALNESCRHTDIVARRGGDEFVALLSDCSPSDGDDVKKKIAENLNTRLRQSQRRYPLSVSVGSAQAAPGDSRSLEELIQAADEQMYQTKLSHHGRNPRSSATPR